MSIPHPEKIDTVRLKKLWSLDLSTKAIAERMGKSQTAISRVAKRLGLPAKSGQARRFQ